MHTPFPRFLNSSLVPQDMSKKQRIIFHIDFDSFFASVEQQYNPTFRNKPLGVTAVNGRSCIIAASREAKKYGVATGSRTFDAYRVCPQLLLTPAHFSRYWEISKTFISICKDYSPLVEVFSLDELFMDVTDTVDLFGGKDALVETIKTRIAKEIGRYITVSVGISHNKLLAKLGSGLNKPDGMFFITPENLYSVYDSIPVTEICGIGERIYRRLLLMGIRTLNMLGQTPLHLLISEFGNVEGQILKNIGQGIDHSSVTSYTVEPEVKSVGRNYCLPHNEYDKRVVLQNLYELCEELGKKLRRLEKKARTLGFGLTGTEDYVARETYPEYFDTGQDIFKRMLSLLKNNSKTRDVFFSPSRRSQFKRNQWRDDDSNPFDDWYIRQIRVWVANLTDSETVPRYLFERGVDNPKILKAVDSLNERYGSHTVRNGYLLYAPKLKTVPNGFMGDRYERIKLARAKVS